MWRKKLFISDTILPSGVEHSGEVINGCHSRNTKLIVWIENSGILLGKF